MFYIDDKGNVQYLKYKVTCKYLSHTDEKFDIAKDINGKPIVVEEIVSLNDNTQIKVQKEKLISSIIENYEEDIFYFGSHLSEDEIRNQISKKKKYINCVIIPRELPEDQKWILSKNLHFNTIYEVEEALKIGEKDYLYPIDKCIEQTKKWVETVLSKGMEYKGNTYSCTLEKQNRLASQIVAVIANKENNIPYTPIWNISGEVSTQWDKNELLELYNAMLNYIYPIVKKTTNS